MALLADMLTLSRIPMGLAVVYVGITGGQAALPQVVWLSLLAWTVDSVDGHLKRASAKPPGWIGRNDLTFDVFFSACVAVFFALAGFISSVLFAVWVGILGLVRLLRSRSGTVAANGLVVLTLLVNALHQALLLGGAIVAWACVALALDRKRFSYRLKLFARGIPRLKDGRLAGGRSEQPPEE
jgi:hypothetical protein